MTKEGNFIEISGLAISGIVSNVVNIKIVLNILFDYVYTKGNYTRLSIMASIISAYDGFPSKKFRFTSKYLARVVPRYMIILRYIHGFITPEEVRNYLHDVIKDEDILVPHCSRLASKLLRRVLSEGLIAVADDCLKDSLKPYNVWLKYLQVNGFTKYYRGKTNEAITNAIKNSVSRFVKDIEDFDPEISGEEISLKEIINKLILIDVDSLVALRRQSNTLPVMYDRVFKEAAAKVQRPEFRESLR